MKIILVGTACTYVLICLLFYLFQESIIFLPDTLESVYQYDFEFPFEERNFRMPDGAVINAVHFRKASSRGVVFYHHGNGGSLARWGELADFFSRWGYDGLVYDYRGYGKSKGARTEQALLADAQHIYDELVREYGEDRIILYGRSFGSGPASWLAGENRPRLLILETPYYSLVDVAKRHYPIFPAKLMLRYQFPSYRSLQRARCPIYIFHGTDDRVVPFASGEKLFKSLEGDHEVQLITLEGGSHNNLVEYREFHDQHELIFSR